MTGASSVPRFSMCCEGREDLLVRQVTGGAEEHQRIRLLGSSVLAGVSTRPWASGWSCRPLDVSTELGSHRRQQFLGEDVLAARAEALEQRRAEHRGWRSLVDRRPHRPAPFARVGHVTGELRELAGPSQCRRGQVEQPRRDDAAAPPDLGNLRLGRGRTGNSRESAAGRSRRLSRECHCRRWRRCRIFRPSAYASMSPYSIALWTILTKWPAPLGPVCR